MQSIRDIRLKMGYSYREFAQLLGVTPEAYEGYDTDRRKCPESVLKKAQEAYKRDRYFFEKHLPASVDRHSKKGVPNEAKKNSW